MRVAGMKEAGSGREDRLEVGGWAVRVQSESGKVGRVWPGGWVASFKTPEAEPFCGMH